FLFFFFFQAEDGIRDRNVTGVQTCALPIFLPQTTAAQGQRLADRVRRTTAGHDFLGPGRSDPIRITVSAGVATFPINDRIQKPRSEERRVGKEWRSEW